MPDGDKIGKFSRRWSKMYTKLCEDHFDNESLAFDAIMTLRKDVEDYGNHPVRFLKEASSHLENVLKNPLFLPSHDWSDEDQFIRNLKFSYMRNYQANQRGMDLAIKAYKEVVHVLRNGGYVSGNLNMALTRGYLRHIYDNSFTDLVPLTLQSQMNANSAVIIRRSGEMDIYIDKHIESMSSQIVKKENVKRLRMPLRSLLQKGISLTDDVFNLGNNR